MVEVLVFIPLCFVFAYGIVVHRRLAHQHPQQKETRERLVRVTLAFLVSYIVLAISHHFERGMGIISHVFATFVMLTTSLGIVPAVVDLYIFPIYKFVQAPTAGIKRVLYVSLFLGLLAHVVFLSIANWHVGFRVLFLESENYAGFNDLSH